MTTAFGSLYEQMIKELKQELNIHGDETSWRIDGINQLVVGVCWKMDLVKIYEYHKRME